MCVGLNIKYLNFHFILMTFDPIAAIRRGDLQGIQTNTFDLEWKDENGKTPLLAAFSQHASLRNYCHELIEYLIYLGCNVNASDQRGNTHVL